MPNLSELLAPRSRAKIEVELLAHLAGDGFPTDQWAEGSPGRTIARMIATGLRDRETLIAELAAGGFLDLAAVLTDAAGLPMPGWLEVLAAQMYRITGAAETYSRVRLTLTCTSGPGPYIKAAGELIAESQAGNHYTNIDEVTIPDGGSVTAVFQAEQSGQVLDATGTIDELTTPLPGVTVANVSTQFSDPVAKWSGAGTITPTMSTPTPERPRTLRVKVVASGAVGTALISLTTYETVDGRAVSAIERGPFALPAALNDGEILLTFADNGSALAFVGGDYWFISVPGLPLLSAGSEAEAPGQLAQRCRDRWPSLSAIPTEGKIAAWVRQCSVENGFGITRITTAPSNAVAGRTDVRVADGSGYASPEQLAILQSYIDARLVHEPFESVAVLAAESVAVTLTGTVRCRLGTLATVQAAFAESWAAYLSTVPIAGEMPGHLVRVGKVFDLLTNAGAYAACDLALSATRASTNGNGDLVLGGHQVPVVGTDSLTWQEVA
ncbi:MAG: baseplate J/gp47 family protein [Deltaproteobacteria bacterium]|nr:baseplate J/gp47 family protein [Deltaproteobacteria bacterium]